MTNIWADSFKEIREPHFTIADPYTLSEEKKEKGEKDEDEEWEGSEEDSEEDKKLAKKNKMSMKEWEKSPEDKKHDKKEVKEEKDDSEDDSEKAGEKHEGKYKKTGKKSKDYDGDGEVEDEADEYAGVKDRAIKRAMRKEERDLKSKTKNDKVDVKSGIHNKININPTIKEEFVSWVESIVEEGYDLSEFTWDEMFEIYESTIMNEEFELEEMNSSAMPPKGDAEQKFSDSSKRIAAQAQIRKEKADLQLATAKSRAKITNESIFIYLNNRYNLED